MTSLSVARRLRQSSLVVVPLGSGGAVSLGNGPGRVHASVEVVGWFREGDGLVPAVPQRILDTRTGVGAPAAPVGAKAAVSVDVVNRAGYPADGAQAAVLSVTASRASKPSGVTLWPSGQERPGILSLSTAPGQDRTTLVIVGVGAGGSVSLANSRGTTHLSIDLLGWLRDDGSYRAIAGTRLLSLGSAKRSSIARKAAASASGRIDLRVGEDPLRPDAPAGDVEDPARVAVTGGSYGGYMSL
ncbi:MAG: hypothetical protein JHC71_11470, partial [Blastococcus sp.]|nr:hypothetical protein [Blastococcus sp.]